MEFQDFDVGSAIGDVDGNGTLDIVLAISDQVQVSLGDGRGGLSDMVELTTILMSQADFLELDGDGAVDLGFFNPATDELGVAHSAGLSYEVAPSTVSVVEGGLARLALSANFNGGGPAMVTIDADGGEVEAWAIGPTGLGSLLDRAGIGSGFDLLVVDDMNGDGLDDVLLGRTGDAPGLRRYFAGGNGELVGQQDVLPELGVPGDGLSAMCVGDFDGDGAQDIAVAVTNSLLFGLGDGVVGFSQVGVEASSEVVTTLAAVDLDGDGRDELIAVENGEEDAAIVRVLSGVDSTLETVFELQPGHRLANVSVGDLNEDSVPDFAVSDNDRGVVEVMLSNP